MNTAAEIKQRIAERSKPEKVEVEGLGVFTVRKLTVKEVLEIAKLGDERGGCHLVATAVLDASGQTLFTPDEVAVLDLTTYRQLTDAASKVNNLPDRIEAARGN
ncbi:MAG TPA: hypothetical protein VF184_05835 [Phycisphaeraceae bacterium]